MLLNEQRYWDVHASELIIVGIAHQICNNATKRAMQLGFESFGVDKSGQSTSIK
jgi:hypothetical protein